MKIRYVRWLLAPVTQWRVHRLMATQVPSLPYEVAWTLARLERKPEELPFAQAAWQQKAARSVWHTSQGSEQAPTS